MSNAVASCAYGWFQPTSLLSREVAQRIRGVPPRRTDETFSIALRRLLAERDISRRGLEKLAAERGATSLTAGAVSNAINGRDIPGARLLAAVSETLELDDYYFVEQRLRQARMYLDEREPPKGVGFERASANLEAFIRGLGPNAETMFSADTPDRDGREALTPHRRLRPRRRRDRSDES